MGERVVLCYGDSNTHGTMPMANLGDMGRFGAAERWPGVLAAELGSGWRVVEEGLPGRTTVYPDPISGVHKNGLSVLPAALESHRPLDVVVVMLGTNDLKHRFQVPPVEIGESVGLLVHLIRHSYCGPGTAHPAILLVAPPPVLETGCLAEIFEGGAAKSAAAGGHLCGDGDAARLRLSRRGRGDRVEPARRGALRCRRARLARTGGGRGVAEPAAVGAAHAASALQKEPDHLGGGVGSGGVGV